MIFQRSLVPTSRPRKLPLSIGPPDTPIVGRFTLAAPINRAGVVLSHPINSTTPSSGLARSVSSTSMLARLRKNIPVGRVSISPVEITGNSMGTPPASRIPSRTCWARSRKWELQGVSSDQVLQMPITGRPSKLSVGTLSLRTQLRCAKLCANRRFRRQTMLATGCRSFRLLPSGLSALVGPFRCGSLHCLERARRVRLETERRGQFDQIVDAQLPSWLGCGGRAQFGPYSSGRRTKTVFSPHSRAAARSLVCDATRQTSSGRKARISAVRR